MLQKYLSNLNYNINYIPLSTQEKTYYSKTSNELPVNSANYEGMYNGNKLESKLLYK